MKIKIEINDGRNIELTRFYHRLLQRIINRLYMGDYRNYRDFESDVKKLELQLMNLEPAHVKPSRIKLKKV